MTEPQHMSENNTICIRPTEGHLVRDPFSGVELSSAGEEKPANAYWLRRLKDDEVEECEIAAAE